MRALSRFIGPFWRAALTFNAADGWAIASHVALSSLMAIFPFLIFLTAIAAFFDLSALSATVVALLFESVPARIAAPIANEVKNVLLVPRGDVLTFGVALALWFASSGVEAMRVGLNRAYGMVENRNFVWLRLESIGFVLLGTLTFLTIGFLVVLAPVAWKALVHLVPAIDDFAWTLTLLRFGLTLLIAGGGLLASHLWLPAGHRSIIEILPGVILTLAAWIAGAYGFSLYIADFANYASTYAGLAGVMTAIVFLYLMALILLYGAALNAALGERRRRLAKTSSSDEPLTSLWP
ncbi:YihY/virulence factor BrkB family protein [Pleomorphomonas oryzae]|uniref:YihY/virulence factor BrkB family protein n=1 Tax=Pleomorphomonas oryzae TaxID=261934 RepID=UPI0003FC743B|nr:YihY/virulence factor BrkB family protein [Pleomorphomonas oryzae]